MNNLDILCFRNLTSEQIEYLKLNYLEIYNFYIKKNQKTIDYKFYNNLIFNKNQYKINNLRNLSKNELIKFMKKKYKIFEKIKKTNKVQYKQFLYLFFRCIIYGYKSHYLKNYLNEENYPWSKNNIVYKKETPKNKHFERLNQNENTSLPLFTTNQFININNIFYSKFIKLNPEKFKDLLININKDTIVSNNFKNIYFKNDSLLSPNKLRNYLIYIGDTLCKQSYTNPEKFNNEEILEYKYNFNFTNNQIDCFLKIISREQYLKILEYPEI